jgi:saccharopine dehydrogenase (NAD+, L-lysine-forming)
MYLLHHEEIEALAKHYYPEIRRIPLFHDLRPELSDAYEVPGERGHASTTPIEFQGRQIVPIQFLKALLPDPRPSGPRTKGKTNIGCVISGLKSGKRRTIFIYKRLRPTRLATVSWAVRQSAIPPAYRR